jgi:hypothetical protein
MNGTTINPRRGGGTGAGRRKRDVTKQSLYFDDDTWESARELAKQFGHNKHSVVLRQAMQIGINAINTELEKENDQAYTIDDNHAVTKHSIYFEDKDWWDSYDLSIKYSLDHSTIIRHAIRLGVDIMSSPGYSP